MYNSEEAKLFSARASQGLCSHAYIVDGEAGIGKLDFALHCAKTMLCTSKNKPCGFCESCRKVQENNHPDIYIVGQEKNALIADVREIIRRAGLKPNDGDKQIFIVCNAGKLRDDSQNALLKIFEEPPETVALFLLTESRSALLPTVLSRGQRIHLDGMSDKELELEIASEHPSLDRQTINNVVRIAAGNPSKAKKYLSKENVALREKAEKLLGFVLAKNSYEVFAMLVGPKHKRDSLLQLLSEFALLVAEAQKGKYAAENLALPTNGECSKLLETAGKKALVAIGDATLCAMESLESNANITAAMSKLSIDLLRAAMK